MPPAIRDASQLALGLLAFLSIGLVLHFINTRTFRASAGGHSMLCPYRSLAGLVASWASLRTNGLRARQFHPVGALRDTTGLSWRRVHYKIRKCRDRKPDTAG